MMKQTVRMIVLSAWIGGGLLLAPGTARAGYLSEAGLGTASALLTFVYGPIKISYAAVGGVIGGLGYLLSAGSVDVAKKIWVPSLGGTYVITPQMLQGEEPIRIFGSSTAETAETVDLEY
ncbi:MAG: hypothetical protein AB1515_02710 [Nitrospirota bacterium]